jgi:hypothetical protein
MGAVGEEGKGVFELNIVLKEVRERKLVNRLENSSPGFVLEGWF